MIMARNDGGSRQSPPARHPWRNSTADAGAATADTRLRQKVCMACTQREKHAIRVLAGARSESQFLRDEIGERRLSEIVAQAEARIGTT